MSNFFYDMNKRMADLAKGPEQLTEGAQPAVTEDFGTTAAIVGGAALGAKLGKTLGIYRDAKGKEQAGLAKPRSSVERIKGSWKGTSHPEYDDEGEVHKIDPKYQFEDNVDEGSTGDYSARKARAGKDIGKPGKNFSKIAKGAAERYGSKERGEKVAGAVLAKLRKGVGEGNDGNLANNAKPYDKVTRGDVVAGRLGKDEMGGKAKDVKEGGRDMTPELTKRVEKASGGKESLKRDTKGVLQLVKKKAAAKKTSPMDEVKLADLPVRQIKGRAYGAQPEEFDQDDDEMDTPVSDQPKKKGRPKGTGRKLGAKSTGTSKLARQSSIREDDIEIQDQGEYDQEGDMAKDDIHTLVRDAQALEKILGDNDNLPEWVQAKLTKARGMISAVSDYMQTERERAGEKAPDMALDEKAVSVAQRRAAGIAHAAQKGDIPKSELRGASKEMAKMPAKELKKFAKTKEKGLPKKKEEVEETTTAGSVATAPAEAPKKSKGGMQFGKGIYDSMSRDLEAMIAESMSVNISSNTEGSPSVSVSATDEDAAKLAQILKAAGIGTEIGGHGDACPTCGSSPCGCAEQVDENQPDWPTNTEQSDDALQYSGGLNKPKTTVAGDGQTTVPVTAVQVREGEEQLDESTCNECGMYESKCECDKEEDMDESIQRMQNLAGIQEAKPDFLDLDRDGNKTEPMKKAADDKDDKKVEESILDLRRLWQEYKG
jgi:hypothetical protein